MTIKLRLGTETNLPAALNHLINDINNALATFSPGSTTGTAPQVEQLVGQMGRPYFNTSNAAGVPNAANYNQLENASAITLCNSPVSDIRLGFGSWYNPGGGNPEALFGNTLTYRASIVSTGASDTPTGVSTYQKLYFANGQDNITPVDGCPVVLTDPCNFGFPASATVYFKTNIQCPANGGNLPIAPFVNYSTDTSAFSSTSTATTPQIYSASTAVTVPSGGTAYTQTGAIVAIGKPMVPQVCFTAQADSFGEGIGDTALPLGYINKGGVGAGVAFMNNARGSQTLGDMEAGCQRQRWTWRFSTDIIDAVVRNDITNGTLTTLQNMKLKFWSDMKATQGCTGKPLRVGAVLIPPYTTTAWRLMAQTQPSVLPSGYLASIVSGGTGYAASSTFNVTISGGTLQPGGTATVLSVSTNSSGVVTTINSIVNQGLYLYTAPPVGNQYYTGGTATTAAAQGGSGLTISVYYEGWFDLANQATQPAFGNGQLRDTMNQWMISQVGQGLLDAAIDCNTGKWEQNPTINGLYHGLWRSDLATASYETYDGTHPSPRGHVDGGNAITAYLNGLTLP